MPEQFNCPDCGKKLNVPDHLLGRRVKCPGCGNTFLAQSENSTDADESDSESRRRDNEAISERPRRRRTESDYEEEEDLRVDERYEEDDDEEDEQEERPRRRRRRRRRRSRLSSARAAVMVPGIALLVVGILGVLVGVANIASVVGEWNGPAPNPAYRSGQYAGATVSLIWGIIVTIGGICFTTLRAHGMAKTEAIFALLPCNPCCLLGLPFGIWALNVMKDRDVYDAFQ